MSHTDAQQLISAIEGIQGDAVRTVEQNLSSSQKAIARENIGAADESDLTQLAVRVSDTEDRADAMDGAMAIVCSTDVAPKYIPSGSYVLWKGVSCIANGNIAQGATLSSSNLTACSNGALNSLNDGLSSLNSNFANLVKTKTDYNLTSDANGVIVSSVSKDYALVSYYYSNYILLPFRPLATSQYWHFVVCDVASTGVLPQTNVTRDLYVKYIEQ
jgi:hypothetical protein